MNVNFSDPDFQHEPWPAYSAMRADGGVRFFPDAGSYVLTSHAAVKYGLTEGRLGADYPLRPSRLLLGPNMLDTDGTLHRTLRRIVNSFFGARSVQRLRHTTIQPAIDEVLTQIAANNGEPFDFVYEVARLLPYRVMAGILGVPLEHSEWLYHAIRPIVAALDYPPPTDREAVEHARDELHAYCVDALFGTSRAAEAETITGQLAQLAHTDALSRSRALSSLMLMLVATTETSISAISNIMYCAQRWPAQARRSAPQEFVRESLRLQPPLHSVARFAKETLTLNEVVIQRRWPVLLVIASANRDKNVFAHPDELVPQQDSGQAIPFGAGQHACPGGFLAETEFTALFSQLFARFRIELADIDEPVFTGHIFRRPRALRVRAFHTRETD